MTAQDMSSCAIVSQTAPIGESSKPRPRVAVFSLTSCEGCSLAILELESQLSELLNAVEFVNFREAVSERNWAIDIAFVDGAVSTPHDEEALREIRTCSTTLVAIGACACLGGVNTLKNSQLSDDYRRYVYGEKAVLFPTNEARPLSSVVKVDFELPGCPMNKDEFLDFVARTLAGRTFRLPSYPVCAECKRRGTLCMYEKGAVCLGPITRGGCEAICPHYGAKCEGCRGIVSDEALAAFLKNMHELYEVDQDDVLAGLRLFGAVQRIVSP